MPFEVQLLEPRLALATSTTQQAVDIVAKAASWDAATDVLTITYSKTAFLTATTAIKGALFWATGPNRANIITPSAPAYSFSLNPSQGDTTLLIKRAEIAQVPLRSFRQYLDVRTTQATHMILIVDSGSVIAESNEQNNLLPIKRELNIDVFLNLYKDRVERQLSAAKSEAFKFLLQSMKDDERLDLAKDPRVAAYMFGTMKVETKNTFLPVREGDPSPYVQTEHDRLRVLLPLYGPAGANGFQPTNLKPAQSVRASDLPKTWAKLPDTRGAPTQNQYSDPSRPDDIIRQAKGGGNFYVYRATDNHYYGRGYVQLTLADNYKQWGPRLGLAADALLDNPDTVLDPGIAYRIMSEGMRQGLFRRGNPIGRYINDMGTDYLSARQVINGVYPIRDTSNRASLNRAAQFEIARAAFVFENLLRDSTVPNKASASVNQGPTDIILSATTVNEMMPWGTVVGTLTTTDPNAEDTFTYSLVPGKGSTDNARFRIVDDKLQTGNAAEFDVSSDTDYSVRVLSTDQGGLSAVKTFTITVKNVSNKLMEFVTVGDAGNADDTTGYGAVNQAYRIGKYRVTAEQYVEFLNAAAKSDPYSLYKPAMGISRTGSNGSYAYSTNRGTSAIAYVSWFDAARFANWMHNGQGSGSTEKGAYTLNGATSGDAPGANPGAKFYIPTENQWYKAAYYKKPGYSQYGVNSYGTVGMGADAWEWNDLSGAGGSTRGLRGGRSGYLGQEVNSSIRLDTFAPSYGVSPVIYFRLASRV